MTDLLKPTKLLNFNHPSIEKLVHERQWQKKSDFDKIGHIYHFVRDEILFGYNAADDITASDVLVDGYGQCNTKATLLMALLRKVGIACRIHGFTIDKQLQKGAIPPILQQLAPNSIIHSWVEVFYQQRWLNLEGFIIDATYLTAVQSKYAKNCAQAFCGYGIATTSIHSPEVNWQGKDTYIQKEGINCDFGVFSDPDSFYKQVGTNLQGLKRVLYVFVFRHIINWNVSRIRRIN